MDHHNRKKFFSDLKYYFWDDPFLFKVCADQIIRCCVLHDEGLKILFHCHNRPTGGYYNVNRMAEKVLEGGFYWPSIFRDAHEYVVVCDKCQRTGNISKRDEMLQKYIFECEVFDV